MLGKIKGLFKVKRNIFIILGVVVVIIFLSKGYSAQKAAKQQAELDAQIAEEDAAAEEDDDGTLDDGSEEDEEDDEESFGDAELLSMQPDLIKSYGRLPEGYIWDMDGEMLSLGDKDMSAEDVVYAYLTGIRTLDLSMAQKYSRNSYVVSNYSDFFNKDEVYDEDYYDSFIRSMFKESLLSIKVKGITDSALFAENKQVFTVEAEMLDLSDKDFWEKDKDKIYDNLFIYNQNEDDSVKAEMYLYDYVLKHYQSGKAATKKVSFDLTVERYPDIDTGWLVSIDKDVYDACVYSDGMLMVTYIRNKFMEEGYEERLEDSGIDTGDPDSGIADGYEE